MRRRRIPKTVCFGLGMAGAGMSMIAGLLMAVSFGQMELAHWAAFGFTGAMLLFLAAAERGEAQMARRLKLVGLFAMLLVSYFRLPPLDMLEIPVLPLLALLYWQKGDGPVWACLWVAEALVLALRYLGYAKLFGGYALPVMGVSLVLVGAARLVVLLRCYKRSVEE